MGDDAVPLISGGENGRSFAVNDATRRAGTNKRRRREHQREHHGAGRRDTRAGTTDERLGDLFVLSQWKEVVFLLPYLVRCLIVRSNHRIFYSLLAVARRALLRVGDKSATSAARPCALPLRRAGGHAARAPDHVPRAGHDARRNKRSRTRWAPQGRQDATRREFVIGLHGLRAYNSRIPSTVFAAAARPGTCDGSRLFLSRRAQFAQTRELQQSLWHTRTHTRTTTTNHHHGNRSFGAGEVKSGA